MIFRNQLRAQPTKSLEGRAGPLVILCNWALVSKACFQTCCGADAVQAFWLQKKLLGPVRRQVAFAAVKN